MGNGNSTKSMGLEHRYGQTGRSTTVSGKTTTWMVTDFINMQIRFVMTDNLLVIKSKDMVYILGLMVADTKVGGVKASSMGTEYIRTRTL